jgi:predicted secreted hydrolase
MTTARQPGLRLRRRAASGRAVAASAIAACMLLGAVAGCAPPDARDLDTRLQIGELLGGDDTLHARAVEPRPFEFPADHGQHPGFRTEWWYFTGNLADADGREFGYQLTFFRSALVDTTTFLSLSAPSPSSPSSPWRSRHAWMAHFAVSDVAAGRLHPAERFARGAIGLSGADADPFRVWLGDWRAERTAAAPAAGGAWSMFPLSVRAAHGDVAIELELRAAKPVVLHGERGLSRRGAQPGTASYYYSFTRMPTRGSITIAGTTTNVTGASWLDREWSTSVLADGVAGWDWISLQLTDSTELMLYRLRRYDGTADPYSEATFIAADGTATTLEAADFTMTPGRTWSAAAYPMSWRIEVPALRLSLALDAAFDEQELDLSVRYWEGTVRAAGTRAGVPVSARGYLEMTGYSARP